MRIVGYFSKAQERMAAQSAAILSWALCGDALVNRSAIALDLDSSFVLGFMAKRYPIDSSQIIRRVEELIGASSNRYRITVQVANRAKIRRYEEDDYDDRMMKPILRAIMEMSDEISQPEILSD